MCDQTWLQIDYRRKEDNACISMVSSLSTGREIVIGGRPEDLRMPGLPVDAKLASIGWRNAQPVLCRIGAAEILYNGAALESSVVLNPGDEFLIDQFAFRLFADPIEEQLTQGLINTPSRWRIRHDAIVKEHARWSPAKSPVEQAFDDEIRPLRVAKNYNACLRLVESELLRLNRTDELNHHERHTLSLWTIRLKCSRNVSAPNLAEIAQEAEALFPNESVVLHHAGEAYLNCGNFDAAQRCFKRAMGGADSDVLLVRNFARIAERIACRLAERPLGARRPLGPMLTQWLTKSSDFVLNLDAPGDVPWALRILVGANLYGPRDQIVAIARGREELRGPRPTERLYVELHRKEPAEIVDCLVMEYPALSCCDPSLELELALLEMEDRGSEGWFVPMMDATQEEWPPAPVRLHESCDVAISATNPEKRTMRLYEVETTTTGLPLKMAVVERPEDDDIVWHTERCTLCACVELAERMWGSLLVRWERRDYLVLPTGQYVPLEILDGGPRYGVTPGATPSAPLFRSERTPRHGARLEDSGPPNADAHNQTSFGRTLARLVVLAVLVALIRGCLF